MALARRRVVGDLLVTFGGRWVQALIGLAGNVISARALGPTEFGRFGLVMATVTICGTLADAGLTYTAIRFIARDNDGGQKAESRRQKAEGTRPDDTRYALRTTHYSPRMVGRVYLLLRLCTGTIGALLGVLLAAPISGGILGYPDLTPYLQISFLTLFSLSISSYPGTVLVGLSRFRRLGVAGVLNAIITLAGILALFVLGQLSLPGLIAWNVVLPLASTLPAWFFIPANWLPWRLVRHGGDGGDIRSPQGRQVVREMVGFSKWIGLSLLGSILVSQGDLLLLGRLATPAVVGVYSVALALAGRLDTLNQSLFTVMMPRASRLESAGSIKQYWRQVAGGSLALTVALGIVALLAQPLIILLYGDRYTASAGLFLALLVVVLFDLATSSLFLLAFPLNKPRLLAAADWLRVVVLGVTGWLLIPTYAAYGAVAARFLARLTGTIATLWALRRAMDEREIRN